MITEQRILNYTKGFKEIQQYILTNKGFISSKVQKDIFKKHQMSKCAMTRATELNYFKKVAPCKFKCFVLTFEPIHARKVIEKTNIKAMESYNNKKNTVIEQSKKINFVKPKKNKKTTSLTKPVEKKSGGWSFFWGLFKKWN